MNEYETNPVIDEEKNFDNLTDEEREEFETYLDERDREQFEEIANDPNFGPAYYE